VGSCFCSDSNFTITTCRHRGAIVTFSSALTSQVLLSIAVSSGRGLAENCSSIYLASFCWGWGLCPSLPFAKTVSAACPVNNSLHIWGTLPTSANDILQHWKSIVAPDPFIKSMPSRPAASVGSEHTKNVWLYSRPFNTKETYCLPLISSVSPVTPYGFSVVTLMSLFDTPACNIEW